MKTKNNNNKSFVMIGSGNLAGHLTAQLVKNKFVLKQVYSPNKKHAEELAVKFNSGSTSETEKIIKTADIYFVCVKDDAIKKTASRLNLKNKLVIHCSGAVSINALKKSSENFGVLYPLYTFSKNDVIDFSEFPIFIEGNNADSEKEIISIANKTGKNAVKLDSKKREKLHLAAVISSNFSNFLFTLSEEYLSGENAGKFEYLVPLIKKTVSKLDTHTPREAQTGPARRNDKKVIKNHKALLKKYPKHKKVYELLSSLITESYLQKDK